MVKNQQWYESWHPGHPDFSADDVLLAVGVRCRSEATPLHEFLGWAGLPAKVFGNTESGVLAYYFENDDNTFIYFEVINEHVKDFGTCLRNDYNANRCSANNMGSLSFNILETMTIYEGSPMQKCLKKKE